MSLKRSVYSTAFPLLVVMGCVSLCFLSFGIVVFGWFGPSPEQAFKIIFKHSPPEYVGDLKLKYETHMKGDLIYLGFVVPPEKLPELLGDVIDPAVPMVEKDGEFVLAEDWDGEEVFGELFPGSIPDKGELLIGTASSPGTALKIVYSVSSGYVFCTRLSDPDLDR